jgi:hypothetical protein
MRRGHISLKIKLAAALLHMRRATPDGRWELIIPHSAAVHMTADQIISKFHFDHCPIPHSQGGPDEPWNLDPVPAADHREKTAKIDIPQIAKTKRLSKEHEEFRKRMLTPRDERPVRKSKWASRPFAKARRTT